LLSTFSLEENRGKFDKEEGKEDEKDKKVAKKPEKKKGKAGKGEGEELIEDTREGYSREMETYKTIRQNSLYSTWRQAFKSYRKRYNENVKFYRTAYEKIYEDEMKFEFRWDQTIERLFEF